MTEAIRDFFKSEKIEYYSVGAYSDFKETRPDIIERTGISGKSVIMYLLPYFTEEGENISSYAIPCDYHTEIDRINRSLIGVINAHEPEAKAVGFGDKSPLNEREAAALMGLGVIGDNRLLINEKYGSYVFIGEVVTDIPPEKLGVKTPVNIAECIHCGACLTACPTCALSDKGVCLSEITQRKGELTEAEKSLIKKNGSVWGCDVCQRVCPMNKGKAKTPLDFFYKDRINKLTKERVLSMTDEAFSSRAYAWRKRATVLRNLTLFDEK